MSNEIPQGPPPFLALMEIATGMWRPRAVATVVELGIPDLLEHGPRSISELAAEAGAREDKLYRLLRALARDGLFEERPPRTFALTAASRPLLSNAPDSLRNMILWLGSPWMSRLWDRLYDAVCSDRSVFRDLYGTDIYPYLQAHPAEAAIFHGAMVELTRLDGDLVAAACDLSRFETIIDVGGGAAQQMAAILARYPSLRGVVFDVAELAPMAAETITRHALADRCTFQAGDMRDSVPQGGDAYVLKNMLHDLCDDDAVKLLTRCRAALRSGGAVIVVQSIVPESEGPYLQFLDLQLLLSGAGGKERTRAEFAQLFAAAGLRLAQVIDTPAMLSLLIGEA
jgi:O-methyltransferase domain